MAKGLSRQDRADLAVFMVSGGLAQMALITLGDKEPFSRGAAAFAVGYLALRISRCARSRRQPPRAAEEISGSENSN